MLDFLFNLYELALEAAPWLVLGLVIGGLIKAWLPTRFVEAQLNGKGFMPVFKASIIGAPLPLCSCGVIPAALGLRHAGASKPATVSFLVSTPETGVDSVSVSYALLGPFLAIARPIAAIVSAVVSGVLVLLTERADNPAPTTGTLAVAAGCCGTDTAPPAPDHPAAAASCAETAVQPQSTSHCCEPSDSTSCCDASSDTSNRNRDIDGRADWAGRARAGLNFAFIQLFADILPWLAVGLIFAAAIQTFIPADLLATWGSGLPAMLMMALIGVPMYVCATASTPIAAGLIMAGISPGTALVFLMAGPATNISTLGVIGKELGRRPLAAYLSGVILVALIAGSTVDFLIERWRVDVQTQLSHTHIVPDWAAIIALSILVIAAINALWKKRI